MDNLFITTRLQRRLDEKGNQKFKQQVDATVKSQRLNKRENLNTPEIVIQKKRKTPSAPRYLWRLKTVDGIKIWVLRDFQLHDDYENKYNSITTKKKALECTNFGDDEICEIEEECRRIKESGVEEKNKNTLLELSSEEMQYLTSPRGVQRGTLFDTIYERKSWIDTVGNMTDTFTSNYGKSILSSVEEHCGQGDSCGWLRIPVQNRSGEYIAAFHHDDGSDSGAQWILFGILKGQEEPEAKYGSVTDVADLIHTCRRFYPATILYDLDFWQGIEQDKYGNIILSGEERSIVTCEEDRSYPIFLTGRAGSGKSTVLQYLFAEEILIYLEVDQQGGEEEPELFPPAYISYNEDLIDIAKKLTQSLLSNNPQYREPLDNLKLDYQSDVRPLIENDMFFVFNKLVRDSIREHNPDALKRFLPENRISFSRFKKEWARRFGKLREFRSYPPSLCWHVIKTYIKGWDGKDYLTPEAYIGIGQANQTVKMDDYRFIFNNVWEKWYKTLSEKGLWDDQDLVRYCLHNESGEPYVDARFSAIFCDESQDFTRTELEFILKLSAFSNKDFSNNRLEGKIPFVFAGDEFQTLSPTGFSWDSLRASYKEKLSKALNLLPDRISSPEPIILNNNYRSTTSIVKLSNRLQLLRETRFGQKSNPQATYFQELGAPVFYLEDSEAVWNRLKEQNVVLIVPSDEGQPVKEYIENSPLKEFIRFYEDGSAQDITILNPAQAKGIDYPDVVVYGFGQEPELISRAIIDWFKTNQKCNQDKDVDLKFLLNNLYVAVTRAKDHLYIVMDKGVRSIWELADAENPDQAEAEKLMLRAIPDTRRHDWADQIGMIVKGNLEDICADLNHDYDEITFSTAQRAESTCDAGMMRQAANRFKERGREREANHCFAKAAVLDEDFLKGAKLFVLAEEYKEAAETYWMALNRDSLKEVLKCMKELRVKTDDSKAALCADILSADTIEKINSCLHNLAPENVEEASTADKAVRSLLAQELIARITPELEVTPKALEGLGNQARRLLDAGIAIDVEKIALLFFNNRKFNLVKEICSDLKDKPEIYYKAMVELTDYPERTVYYRNAGFPDWQKRTYDEYKANSQVKLSDKFENYILPCIISVSTDNAEMLSKIPVYLSRQKEIPDANHIVDCLKKAGIEISVPDLELFNGVCFSKAAMIKKALPSSSLKDANKRMAEKLAEVLDPSFKLPQIDNVKSYFEGKYRNIGTVFASPLLLALGERMESRGIHIDSMRFYEWAATQAFKDDKRLFKLLRLRCQEAKNGGIPEPAERRELDAIDLQPEIERAKTRLHERLYDNLLTSVRAHAYGQQQDYSDKVPETQIKKEADNTTDVHTAPAGGLSSALPTSIDTIPFGVFQLFYNPKRSLLKITHPDEHIDLNLHKCEFPEDDIFTLTPESLLAIDGVPTNMRLEFSEANVVLTLTQEGISMGCSISFKIGK